MTAAPSAVRPRRPYNAVVAATHVPPGSAHDCVTVPVVGFISSRNASRTAAFDSGDRPLPIRSAIRAPTVGVPPPPADPGHITGEPVGVAEAVSDPVGVIERVAVCVAVCDCDAVLDGDEVDELVSVGTLVMDDPAEVDGNAVSEADGVVEDDAVTDGELEVDGAAVDVAVAENDGRAIGASATDFHSARAQLWAIADRTPVTVSYETR